MKKKLHAGEKRGRKQRVEAIVTGFHETIELKRLIKGDVLKATLTDDEGGEKVLVFTVKSSAGETGTYPGFNAYPECTMHWEGDTKISPRFLLEGTAVWTTRKENPAQTQDTALSISYGFMQLGGHITLFIDIPTEARQRQLIDMHGVKVTKLEVVR